MQQLEAWRCPNCRGMLAKVKAAPGAVVEIRCHTCKTTSTLDLTGDIPIQRSERPLVIATKL